jgi:uncharacterized protein
MTSKETPASKRGCVYWLRLLTFAGVVFLLIFLPTWEYAYVDSATRPAPSVVCCKTPASYGLVYSSVRIPSPEGFTLAAWYIPSHNGGAVVMLHGYGANRLEMMDRAAVLGKQGFGVLLYDLRGHGESGGSMRALGWPDTRDLQAVINFLQLQTGIDRFRIGAFGFSIGGQVVVRTAAEDSRIRAILVDDPAYTRVEDIPPMASWQENFETRVVTPLDLHLISRRTGIEMKTGTVEAIAKLSPRPLFLISSGQSEMSRILENHFFSQAGEPKEIWVIPEAGHGGTFAARPEEYADRIIRFFSQWLLAQA